MIKNLLGSKKRFLGVVVCVVSLLSLSINDFALATVTVTTATGGSAISADTTGGTYTALTGPVVTEGATADIGTGTIILNAPSGFQFNTGNNVTATRTDVSGTGCNASRRLLINAGSSQTVTPTTTTIAIDVTRATSSGCRNIITWTGIQVRPTAGTPLASGDITKTGTSTIVGITNSSTNLGALTEVVGAKNKLVFSTQPSATATINTDFTTKPVITLEDQFGNRETSDSSSTVTLAAVLSTQTCGGTAGSGSITSTPASGTAVSSGLLTYTAMQYSAGESIKICASSTGVTSALSNTIVVSSPPTVTGVTASNTNGAYGATQVIGVQVNFSAAVTVTGTPQLTLSTGSPATTAVNYTSGSGTSTLTFNYTVSAGNTSADLDYSSTSALALNGGTIKDTATGTFNAILTLATPGAANSLGANKNIVIDTTNPTSTISSPADNSYSTSTTVALSGTSSDTNLSTTTISVDGGSFVATSGTAASWTYSATSLSQGAHTFQSKATDAAGNTGLSTLIHVTVDSTNPTSTISSPADNSYSTSTTVALSGTSSDTNLSTTTISVDGGSFVATSGTAASWTYSATSLSQGAHTFQSKATDAAGNTGLSTLIHVTVDSVNPVITINNPTTSPAQSKTITASVDDGTLTQSVTTGSVCDGTLTFSAYSSITFTSESDNGKKVCYKAVDSAFNTSYLMSNAIAGIDTTSPTVNSVSVQTGLTINITFSESVSSGVTIASNYTLSGTGKGTLASNPDSVSLVSGNTYVLTWTSGLMISGGDITITVANVQDLAGNSIGTPNSGTHAGGGIGLDHFVFDTVSTQTSGVSFSIRITAKDVSNNTVSNYTGTVDLTSTAGSVNPTTSNNFVSGALNQLITISGYGASTTITATDHGGTKTGTSNSFTIIAPTTKFVIINPTDGTVDNSITVTIQAQRADNSIDTAYQEDVTLVASGSATGEGLVSIINGVGTKNLSDTVTETVNLSLSDTQGTTLDVTSSQDVVFASGALAQFELSDATTLAAGSRQAYTVTRKDQYGNLITSGISTVYLYSTSTGANKKFYNLAVDGTVITQIDIADGSSTADFWYYDTLPGTYSITASDNASTPDGNTNVNDAVDSIVVTAGPVSQYLLNDPGDVNVDTRLGYIVTRKDQFNNLATTSSNTVYLYAPSGTFYDASVDGNTITQIDITGGNSTANFWYSNSTPGTYTITASDSTPTADGSTGIIDAQDSAMMSAIPIVATRFVILNPTDGTVDNPITVTVQAQDNSGNIDTTYQSDVTLVASGSATGEGLVDIVNGIGTLNISDATAETVDLSLSDTQGTGLNVISTQNVIFAVGGVSQFSINNPGDISAGSRIGYTVTRKDQYGNLITSGLTKVYLYGLPIESTKKFYDASSGGSVITFVNITDGNSTANFWYYDEHAATSTVVVSDNATYPDGSTGIDDAQDDISVSASSVAKFTLDNPGDMSVGTRLGYTVSRFDQFDNPVTAGVTVVYLYSSSTGANVKFYDASTGGLVITSTAIDNGNSTASFWYYDEAAGTWVITASDSTPTANGNTGVIDAADTVVVSTIPIVATRFVISSSTSGTVGTPLTITVEAQDNSGNIDTTYQNDVTLVASGSATGEGLVNIVNGVGTLNISDAVAETVNLSLSDTQSTGLNVTSTRSVVFSTTPVFEFGAGGSGTAPLPVVGKVSFSGRAYPGAKLSMVAVKEGEDQVIEKETVTSSDGSFSIEFIGLTTGSRSYALLVQDKEDRLAQSKIFDLNLLNDNSVLDISNIVVSPTVGFPRPTVTKGDFIAIVGNATPGSKVNIKVDDNPISKEVFADNLGEYKYLFNTLNLAIGSHTVKASQSVSGVESEISPQKVFFVTNLTVPKTDFNNDGKINISDWSIFLARWISKDDKVKILDDLNGDGKVNATDFSIFIRTLRR